MNLELVTVTATAATITWFTGDPTSPDEFGRPEPVPADTVFEIGTSPAALERVVERDDETPYHYVEVVGLEPGRPYFYRAISNGIVATPTQVLPEPPATGAFTTLVPPPGRELFTMCWANDVHIGEMVSGLAISNGDLPGGGFPPGYAADPANPYWRFMAEAAVAESRDRGAELMLFNGDLTAEAEPVHMAEARRIFDGFGPYQEAYYVTRGNHDRAHAGPEWAGCRPAAVEGYNDCILDTFFPDGQTFFSFDHKGVHIVGLDTNELTSGDGAIAPEQFEWLEADLAAHSGTPTFLFGHHPVSEESGLTAVPPVVFTLNPDDAARLEGVVAEHAVVGVYSGHTHRNKRTSSPRSPGVPYIELGAVKEYPGGFGLVTVYEGGYMVNFHKTRGDESRAWSERSRGEYLGLYPYYTLGTLADRNFVVEADLSDAAPAAPSPTTTAPPPDGTDTGTSTDGSSLPATGPVAGVATVGAAALAGGIAARRAAAAAGGSDATGPAGRRRGTPTQTGASPESR